MTLALILLTWFALSIIVAIPVCRALRRAHDVDAALVAEMIERERAA